jgi:hypothetical protein
VSRAQQTIKIVEESLKGPVVVPAYEQDNLQMPDVLCPCDSQIYFFATLYAVAAVKLATIP